MILGQGDRVFIIFGMGPAGLFLSRQLFRMGYTIYGIGKRDDIGRYSNTLKQYYATESVDSIRIIVENILKISHNIQAYICSDQYLTMFLEEWPDIFSLLSFDEPGKQLLRSISDKEYLIQFCNGIGVRFPDQYEAYVLDARIKYPVIIKPNIKRGYSPIAKVTIIQNEKELKRFIEAAKQKGLELDDLIIQQYIPGDNFYEYGYGGYFRSGKPVIEVTFLQLRQYPQGVSCLACEVKEKGDILAIKELVTPFLEKTVYSGFLQFDIKKHAETGDFYVLDINPRPWGSISILSPKCRSHSLFDDCFTADNVKVKWRFPFKEIVSFKNKNNVSYKRLHGILPKDFETVIDLYDKNDKKPFFMQLPVAVMKASKIVRGFIK